MRLDDKQFKRFKELSQKMKNGKLTEAEKEELAQLATLKKSTWNKQTPGSNAIEYWNKYKALIDGAASFTFNWVAGTELKCGTYALNAPGLTTTFSFPGIGIVKVVSTVGVSIDSTSAVNVQFRQMWLDMHRKYRGIGQYQQADLAIVETGIIDVFRQIARAERIYGVINYFNSLNRNVPDLLLRSLEVDPTEITYPNSIADFRYNINRVIAKARSLCLPKGISVLDDAVILFSNLFKDDDSERAFIFGWDTDFYHVYDAETYHGIGSGYLGGALIGKAHQLNTNGATFKNIIDELNEQVDALLQDDDVARICSDVLAAYGDNGITTLQDVPEDYKVIPIKDEERLLQLHNCKLRGYIQNALPSSAYTVAMEDGIESHTLDIVQVNNTVICIPYLSYLNSVTDTAPTYYTANLPGIGEIHTPRAAQSSGTFITFNTGDVILDTWTDDPSSDMKVEMTRYTTVADFSTVMEGSTKYARSQIIACGIYVPTLFKVYTRDQNTTLGYMVTNVSDMAFTSSGVIINVVRALSSCDWSPIIHAFYVGGTNTNAPIGDIVNPTVGSVLVMQRLHDAANLSGFRNAVTKYISE